MTSHSISFCHILLSFLFSYFRFPSIFIETEDLHKRSFSLNHQIIFIGYYIFKIWSEDGFVLKSFQCSIHYGCIICDTIRLGLTGQMRSGLREILALDCVWRIWHIYISFQCKNDKPFDLQIHFSFVRIIYVRRYLN